MLTFQNLEDQMIQYYKENKTWCTHAKVNPILFYTVIKKLFQASQPDTKAFSLHNCVFSPEDGIEGIQYQTNKNTKGK